MLKELLKDWADFDGAQHAIAVSLGLMPNDWHWVLENAKWVFWSNNPLGNMLSKMLIALVEQDVLEENDEQQYRCNSAFIPPWTRQP